MRLGVLTVGLLAGVAWADIPPEEPPSLPDTSCVGKAAGASCGDGGRCVAETVRRPDFSKGSPPTWVATQVLVCRGAQVATRDVRPLSATALGGAVAFLVVVVAVSLRRRHLALLPH